MIVTLLTDFGTRDGYVGAMKGAILERCPTAAIHDISHDVPAGDVRSGALALVAAAPYFPAATVHVAVVDPGVGTERRPLLVTAGGSHLVGPDNGLLSLAANALCVARGDGAAATMRVLDRSEAFRAEVSATFHGRDVFAPVAGSLAAGVPPDELGGRVDSMTTIELPMPVREDGEVVGEILFVDRFGNLITNLTRDEIAWVGADAIVEVEGAIVGPVRRTYGDVAVAEPLALVGSSGHVEIAVRDGSAARYFGCDAGEVVRLGGR